MSLLTAIFGCDNHRPDRDGPVQLQHNLLQALYLANFFKCQRKVKNKAVLVFKNKKLLGLLALLLPYAVSEVNTDAHL